MVALQVRAFEKFNIILEETLGIALGKCVEVISAATDNGDIGTNYPRIRDYTSKFNVDRTLVSTAGAIISQVSPQMLRDGWALIRKTALCRISILTKKAILPFVRRRRPTRFS